MQRAGRTIPSGVHSEPDENPENTLSPTDAGHVPRHGLGKIKCPVFFAEPVPPNCVDATPASGRYGRQAWPRCLIWAEWAGRHKRA